MAFTFTNKSRWVSAISNFFQQTVKKLSSTVLKGPRTSENRKVTSIVSTFKRFVQICDTLVLIPSLYVTHFKTIAVIVFIT